MLRKIHHRILSICSCNKTSLRFSALFINGAKASETFVYVTPHIDFQENLKNKTIILEQLTKRNVDIDFGKVVNLWSIYEELKHRKADLDKKKNEISKELTKLIKNEPSNDAVNKFKVQIDLVKDNIKKLKVPLWSAEEAVILEILKLPNSLHPLTPDREKEILHTNLTTPTLKKDHLKIGDKLNIMSFKKNENYYLKGDAAIFELGAKFYFSQELKKRNFVQFSNPDFVKSVIVEGCGGDHTNSNASFILHHNEDSKVNIDNRLHLTGGGSLCSFFAYHAKNVLYSKVFPLKYFAMGRQYIPSPSEEDSLFHVSQSSVIQFFGAVRNEPELDNLLNELIDTLKSTYSNLGYHFQLSIMPANKISTWESLRISLEMYSTSLDRYVEIANVSVSGDFLSKRLMFTYTDNKQSKFPHIISGTVLNVPKFLGCVLEQDEDFHVPNLFKVENWVL